MPKKPSKIKKFLKALLNSDTQETKDTKSDLPSKMPPKVIYSEKRRTVEKMPQGPECTFTYCEDALPECGVEVLILLVHRYSKICTVSIGVRLAQKWADNGDSRWIIYRDSADRFEGDIVGWHVKPRDPRHVLYIEDARNPEHTY